MNEFSDIDTRFVDNDQLGAHRKLAEGRELTPDEVNRNKQRRGERMNLIVSQTAAGRVKLPEEETSHVNPTIRTK